jgi:cytochrome c-L
MRLAFALAFVFALPAAAGEITFLNALDDSPLEFKYRPDQTITPAVEAFKKTGENPYSGDAVAIAAGEKVYKKNCQACHLKDGSGRIGPNLTDEEWKRARTHTDVGRFEIIYGGGPGAMQPLGRRIDQDDILKVMAYIDTFRAK